MTTPAPPGVEAWPMPVLRWLRTAPTTTTIAERRDVGAITPGRILDRTVKFTDTLPPCLMS